MNKLTSFAFSIFTTPFALTGAFLFFTGIESCQGKRTSASTFIERILHVVRSGAMPEVFGIYASFVIAGVTDFAALWNRALKLSEDYSMREIVVFNPVYSPGDLRVACAHERAGVIPTAGREIDIYSKQNPLPGFQRLNYS